MIEIAMIETMFPTLASNLGMVHNNPDRPLGRTGNRHGGLAISPYNVYPCRDGWFAIICNNDGHWNAMLRAMGRADLEGDPRFATNAARVANMMETDALVEAWAASHTRAEIFAATKQHKVPSAPVRDLHDVLANEHMRGRGMLEDIDHPKLGRITVPGSPMRYHGTPQMKAIPSHQLGADNAEVLHELLGLSASEIEALQADGAI
jgi:crotonobetainyl-CoA:carnitine CoA-transferase CaiB-like acyl-CoA transferase